MYLYLHLQFSLKQHQKIIVSQLLVTQLSSRVNDKHFPFVLFVLIKSYKTFTVRNPPAQGAFALPTPKSATTNYTGPRVVHDRGRPIEELASHL